MRRYNFFLGEKQYARLREIAEWEERSMSELLRSALDAWTDERLAEKRRKIREAGGLDDLSPPFATSVEFVKKKPNEKRRISLAVPPNRITK